MAIQPGCCLWVYSDFLCELVPGASALGKPGQVKTSRHRFPGTGSAVPSRGPGTAGGPGTAVVSTAAGLRHRRPAQA